MISIIIPAYNVENYIGRCLDSLCNLNVDNEIIVVNDGSTDNTLNIAEKFKLENGNENIRIISQENRGLSEARNKGLNEALGEYVSFIDSDDFVDKMSYEKIIKEAMNSKVDFTIGKYMYYYEGEKGTVLEEDLKISEKYAEKGVKSGKEWLKILKKGDNYAPEVWDDIYRREFLIENELYFKPGRLHEDEIFTLEVFLKAERVKYSGIPFYYYFQRKDSIMKTKGVKNYTDMEENIEDIKKLMEAEKDGEIKKILIEAVHRFYKIIIKESGMYVEENGKFKEKYRLFSKKYRENKIKNIFVRLWKSTKKKWRKFKKNLK